MDILDRIYLVSIVELVNFIKELVRSRVDVGGRIFVGLVRCELSLRGMRPGGWLGWVAGSGSRGRLVVGLGGWPVVCLDGVAGGGRLVGGEAWGAW